MASDRVVKLGPPPNVWACVKFLKGGSITIMLSSSFHRRLWIRHMRVGSKHSEQGKIQRVHDGREAFVCSGSFIYRDRSPCLKQVTFYTYVGWPGSKGMENDYSFVSTWQALLSLERCYKVSSSEAPTPVERPPAGDAPLEDSKCEWQCTLAAYCNLHRVQLNLGCSMLKIGRVAPSLKWLPLHGLFH